jgi:hypothetical protein
LHHVKLVFWNDPANREHGAEVRNAYTSALSFVHAARKAVKAHRKNASSIPDEILVQRCPEDRVLWTGLLGLHERPARWIAGSATTSPRPRRGRRRREPGRGGTLRLEVTIDRPLLERLVRLAAENEQSVEDYVADLLEREPTDKSSSTTKE